MNSYFAWRVDALKRKNKNFQILKKLHNKKNNWIKIMYQLNVRSPHQTAAYLAMTLKKDVIYFQVSQNEGLIAPENPLAKILGEELIQSAWSYGSSFAIITIPDVEQFIQDIAKCLKVEDGQESQHTTQIILFLGKNNHKITPQNLKSVYIYIDPFHNANIDITDNLQELEEIVG